MKFTVCINNDTVQPRLNNESATHKDLLFLKCNEGSNWGFVARKSYAAMKVYDGFFSRNFPLLMQVEDDTFVSWRRFRAFLANQNIGWKKKFKNTTIASSYMGVPTAERRTVDRNPDSLEYQPSDIYQAETYPIYMQRFGFILGKDVVSAIVEQGVADARPMANADSAIGVWVDMVKKRKLPVKFVKLQGRLIEDITHEPHMCGAWKDYPFLLQHGLNEKEILCLTGIEVENRDDQQLSECFAEYCKQVKEKAADGLLSTALHVFESAI